MNTDALKDILAMPQTQVVLRMLATIIVAGASYLIRSKGTDAQVEAVTGVLFALLLYWLDHKGIGLSKQPQQPQQPGATPTEQAKP